MPVISFSVPVYPSLDSYCHKINFSHFTVIPDLGFFQFSWLCWIDHTFIILGVKIALIWLNLLLWQCELVLCKRGLKLGVIQYLPECVQVLQPNCPLNSIILNSNDFFERSGDNWLNSRNRWYDLAFVSVFFYFYLLQPRLSLVAHMPVMAACWQVM